MVRVVQVDRALRTGIITLNEALEGLKQTSRFSDLLVQVSQPHEAVCALQLLMRAFNAYYSMVAAYNHAQFVLFQELGDAAREVANFRSLGEVLPLHTVRPPYLPRSVYRESPSRFRERSTAACRSYSEYNQDQLYTQAVVPSFPDDFKLAHESYWRPISWIDYTR